MKKSKGRCDCDNDHLERSLNKLMKRSEEYNNNSS
jgi:hypothetical protein